MILANDRVYTHKRSGWNSMNNIDSKFRLSCMALFLKIILFCIVYIPKEVISITRACDANQNCTITCVNDYECAGDTILWPADYKCDIHCIGNEGCWGTLIRAESSSQLNVYGCIDDGGDLWNVCQSIDVYCPPNVGGDKRCYIEGNDLGLANGVLTCTTNGACDPGQRGLHLYAVHGWADIDFSGYDGSTYTDINSNYGPGTMHCLAGYTGSCPIGFGWTCKGDTVCDITPTWASPTTSTPTSLEPTTSVPTSSTPSTSEPSTPIPTTSNPTTSAPTTLNPTTSEPASSKPSNPTTTTSVPTITSRLPTIFTLTTESAMTTAMQS